MLGNAQMKKVLKNGILDQDALFWICGGMLVLVTTKTTLQPSLKLAYLRKCFYVLQ